MGRAPGSNSSGLKKGPWMAEEDQKLKNYIDQHGAGNWRTLPENAGLQRCGKSCRLRWTNYLRPDIKRGRFSFEEEEAIIQLHSILGNKWSAIAARLPGRTDNEIKNYWNTHIRKRLLRMGLDPVTHAPRLDQIQLNNLSNMLFMLNQQQNQNPQLLHMVTTLLSLNHQQQEQTQQEQFFQQPFSSSSPSFLHGADFKQSMVPEATAGVGSFGSLSNFNCKNQQLSSASTTPYTSYTSSPLDSSYTSYNGLTTDDEIDSVLNFEIPEGFDLSELLY